MLRRAVDRPCPAGARRADARGRLCVERRCSPSLPVPGAGRPGPRSRPRALSRQAPVLRSRDRGLDDYALVGTALSLRGVPYRNGGATPEDSTAAASCRYVFARHGLAMPREVRDQFRLGKQVKPEELEAGDLLFFTTIGPGASHVAIAIGGDQFVHAPSSAGRRPRRAPECALLGRALPRRAERRITRL